MERKFPLILYFPYSDGFPRYLSIVRAPTRQPSSPSAALVTGPVTEKISLVRSVEGKQ